MRGNKRCLKIFRAAKILSATGESVRGNQASIVFVLLSGRKINKSEFMIKAMLWMLRWGRNDRNVVVS